MKPKQMVWTQTIWHIRADRTRTGLMTIPVQLFGNRYDFLIDSGAAYTLLSEEITQLNELPLLQAVPWVTPSGVRTTSPRARVPLQLGGNGGIEVIVNALVVPIPLTFGVQGFLGADVLRQYDVTLEENLLRLSQRVKLPR